MRRAFANAGLLGGTLSGYVITQGDTIAAVDTVDVPEDAEPVDCSALVRGGGLLAPAIIDLGVFAVDRAACHAGGIVRVGLMPDQSPVLDDPGIVRRAALMGKPELGPSDRRRDARLRGTDLGEMAINKAAGAKAVATGRRWVADSGVMRKLLAYARDCGLTVIAHAEDGGLAAGAAATDGETAMRLGLPSAPACAEALAIARDLILAEDTGARIHFRQVTTAQGLDLVRRAKARGVQVTCGITPAHLLLSDIAVSDFRTFAHLSPPLRSEADRRAALAAVADGTIDVLFSGHDPRGPRRSACPFADSEPGMSGAETLFALGMGLVHDGHDRHRAAVRAARGQSGAHPGDRGGADRGGDARRPDPDRSACPLADQRREDGRARRQHAVRAALPVQGRVAAVWKAGSGCSELPSPGREGNPSARGQLGVAAFGPAGELVAGLDADEADPAARLDRAAQPVGVGAGEAAHRDAIEAARLGRHARAVRLVAAHRGGARHHALPRIAGDRDARIGADLHVIAALGRKRGRSRRRRRGLACGGAERPARAARRWRRAG